MFVRDGPCRGLLLGQCLWLRLDFVGLPLRLAGSGVIAGSAIGAKAGFAYAVSCVIASGSSVAGQRQEDEARVSYFVLYVYVYIYIYNERERDRERE
jgi:hypothetical protein